MQIHYKRINIKCSPLFAGHFFERDQALEAPFMELGLGNGSFNYPFYGILSTKVMRLALH